MNAELKRTRRNSSLSPY